MRGRGPAHRMQIRCRFSTFFQPVSYLHRQCLHDFTKCISDKVGARRGLSETIFVYGPAAPPARFSTFRDLVYRTVFVGVRCALARSLAPIVLNAKNDELRRESMLYELKQRIREVRQGRDGY